MKAYHVSSEKYDIGEVVNSNDYIDVTSSRGNTWVEDLLEIHRPKSYPNRRLCVFTFDSIDALGYYSDYLTGNNINYYEVELLDTPYKCPMYLCGFIQKNQNRKKEYLDKLAIEYWNNTMGWNFNEQLCNSFKIIENISKPTILQKVTGMGMYEKDKVIASKITLADKTITNHQRIGIKSNSEAGNNFENIAKLYLERVLNRQLHKNVKVEIGISNTKKKHRFDIGDESIIIECKTHRWTSGNNIPSAKLTVWNEAMYYFSLAPKDLKKIFFVDKDFCQNRNKTLGQYYIDTYGHLIPDDVEIWEFDEKIGVHEKIR